MNNKRRKEIEKCIKELSLHRDVDCAIEKLYDIVADEDGYRDNMPDNLQGGIRYEESEAASDLLNESISYLEDALSSEEMNEKEECISLAISVLSNID